jgi:hypothetical protein
MFKISGCFVATLLGFLYAAPATAQVRVAEASVVPVKAEERKSTLEPQVAQSPEEHVTFQSDPIADGAIIVVSLGSAGVLELINSTGEIRPQQIAPNFDRNKFIWIDRLRSIRRPASRLARSRAWGSARRRPSR